MKILSAILLSLLFINPVLAERTRGDGWGLGVGFGAENPYVDTNSTIKIFTPSLFAIEGKDKLDNLHKSNFRLQLAWNSRVIAHLGDESVDHLSLSLEMFSDTYKDLVNSYVTIGVGVMSLDDDYYDGNIITLPLSLGLSLFPGPKFHGSLDASYFLEYRYEFNDYDKKKSLPGQDNTYIKEKVISAGFINFGLNIAF